MQDPKIPEKAASEAPWQLAAAAPEMLAALRLALSEKGGFACPATTEAAMRAAVAKAEGRS